MNWLLWKDYRLNRLIVIMGVAFLILPHLVALYLAWSGLGASAGGTSSLGANLVRSAIFSIMLSQLTFAFLGGNAIACERADRSAEFLAYLPASRAKILAAKMALALAAAAIIWLPNLLIVWLGMPSEWRGGDVEIWTVLGNVGIAGAVFFCVGWLLSSFLESPAVAVCGGLVAPIAILAAVKAGVWAFGLPRDAVIVRWIQYALPATAALSFVAGTWYYLRRVEP